MQSSSMRTAGASVLFALALAFAPVALFPDEIIAASSLPLPTLVTITNVQANAQTLPASIATTTSPDQKISAKTSAAPAAKAPMVATSKTQTYPRLVVPAIGLDDSIVPVGTDATGAMAVPNGTTSNVGWYDAGPKPGDVGSAVLDAHVFAAFSKLKNLTVGEDIYVENSPTEKLHFVVAASKTFALSQIASQDLFVPTTNRDLNLITCAGKLTPDHSTYDHRLVVYATLVD